VGSVDHQELDELDLWLSAAGSDERAVRMSLWSCSTSTNMAVWIAGVTKIVALREDASCSWVNIGQRLWGLT